MKEYLSIEKEASRELSFSAYEDGSWFNTSIWHHNIYILSNNNLRKTLPSVIQERSVIIPKEFLC